MDEQTRKFLDMSDGLITDMELDDPAGTVREMTRREEQQAALAEVRRMLAERFGR